jgi:hypothetical protein
MAIYVKIFVMTTRCIWIPVFELNGCALRLADWRCVGCGMLQSSTEVFRNDPLERAADALEWIAPPIFVASRQ